MKVMNVTVLRNAFLAALSFSVIAISSCKKDKDPHTTTCGYYGTVTTVACGVSIFNNFWIRLDNGQLLQPCQTSRTSYTQILLHEGDRVKLGFTPASGPDQCDNMVHCKIWQPEHQKVKITCLELVESKPVKCAEVGTIVHDDKSMKACNPYLIRKDDGSMLEPVNQELVAKYADNQRITFSAVDVYTFMAVCSGARPVDITCIAAIDPLPANNCKEIQAMRFTQMPTNPYAVNILNGWIEGNCLKLETGFSGCSDDISHFGLAWDNAISNNTATLWVVDNNPQMCAAYFTKTLSFDLTKLKANAGSHITVKVVGLEKQLQY